MLVDWILLTAGAEGSARPHFQLKCPTSASRWARRDGPSAASFPTAIRLLWLLAAASDRPLAALVPLHAEVGWHFHFGHWAVKFDKEALEKGASAAASLVAAFRLLEELPVSSKKGFLPDLPYLSPSTHEYLVFTSYSAPLPRYSLLHLCCRCYCFVFGVVCRRVPSNLGNCVGRLIFDSVWLLFREAEGREGGDASRGELETQHSRASRPLRTRHSLDSARSAACLQARMSSPASAPAPSDTDVGPARWVVIMHFPCVRCSETSQALSRRNVLRKRAEQPRKPAPCATIFLSNNTAIATVRWLLELEVIKRL